MKSFGPRRAVWEIITTPEGVDPATIAMVDRYDLVYRSLVAIMFNFTQSGHPGGSVSSGRIVSTLLLDTMDYDIGAPNRSDADILSYAAGHKALGLYATLALRDEIIRLASPGLLPKNPALRLRFEDTLGFRRNPTQPTPLFRRFGSKALDGHPTPATPFVKLATGPSGIGVGSSMGLAVAAADVFGTDAPRIHVLEGEGGLTPGRVVEALAFASSAGLSNAFMHIDWNQASIDSDAVTREGDRTPPAGTAATPAGGSNLYYLSYAPESFSVVAQTPAPAYLVFSEVWYPGWRAWVDGAEVPIFRANFAFRGVYLRRPGEHTVVMRFDPVSWKIGLSMTLLTLVAIGGWTGVWLYRRVRRDRQEK